MGIIKGTFILSAGMYGGVYLAQNYRIPPVESPMDLFDKIRRALLVDPKAEAAASANGQQAQDSAKKDPVDEHLEQAKAVASAFSILFKKDPKE